MKKLYYTLILGAIGLAAYADQYLKVTQGENASYFPATGEVMPFNNGQTVTIQGHTFKLSEISSIEVVNEIPTTPGGGDDDTLNDNTVLVEYSGTTAKVTSAANISKYITAKVSGANVSVEQSAEVGDGTKEITYILKGQSDDGSFLFEGSYKSTIELQGLTLTSKTTAPINIQNGKRIELSSKKGTENTLVDCSNGDQKAALYCKGHLELKGQGILNVTGNTAHAISAKEYIKMKNCTVNIKGSVKDAINCNQYFLMESGTINIEKTGDDGIQVSFKDNTNREAEDTGDLTIQDGTITIANVTAAAAKGIKADHNICINGGNITIKTTAAGSWDSTNKKTKASACFSADGDFEITGGTLSLRAEGAGGKCISCDGNFRSTGGDVTGTTTGGALVYSGNNLYQGNYTGNLDNINSDYKSSPKAIKVDTNAVFGGGTFYLTTTGKNGEGIESKNNLTFEGDVVVTVRAYDDGTNSSKDTYIKGGTLDIRSTSAGDGIDANMNIYISGGTVIALGSGGAEQGLDAGDTGAKVYFTGGNILAYGGRSSATPSSSYSNAQAYVTTSQSVSAGSTVEVSLNGNVLGTFTVPQTNPSGVPGMQRGPGGSMGGNSGALLISVPGMVSGTSYTIKVNGSSTTATAKTQG